MGKTQSPQSYLLRESSVAPESLTGEMWGVTAYFNPAGYANKRENLKLFSQGVRKQGLKLLIVELVHEGAHSEVSDETADIVVRVTSNAVLWQKERLQNIGLDHLPAVCDKVVLIDADVLFVNDNWVNETADLLERYVVVQPYQVASWLLSGCLTVPDFTQNALDRLLIYRPGLAFARLWYPEEMDLVERTDLAHPGFAWAARRSVLAGCGIYDRFIIGGGDLILTAAMYKSSNTWNKRRILNLLSGPQIRDVTEWTDRFHAAVNGSVYCTQGIIAHLWHGDSKDRQYLERYKVLKEHNFDPALDIRLDHNQCWCWATDKPLMHQAVKKYFYSRKEEVQNAA